MTYPELKTIFLDWNSSSPHGDLTAHVVFTEDSFDRPYPLIGRTYRISSDNKAFRPDACGYSVFAWCLDPSSDQGVRLDRYMEEEGNPGGWKVRECYVLEHMPDAEAIPRAERTELDNGTVVYAFGGTRVRVLETEDCGETCLEPIEGDQASGGGRTDLHMDRLFGYCELLERHINRRTAP